MSERSNNTVATRRWVRFSLRSLLIVVTVICVVLGTWITRARRLDYAVEHFRRLGGEFAYHSQLLPNGHVSYKLPLRGPLWLRRSFGDHLLDSPAHLGFGDNCPLTDADLQPLKMLPSLQNLYINGADVSITDDGWAALDGLPNLRRLRVDKVKPLPSDAILKHVAHLKELESLQVRPGRFIAAGVAQLKGLTALRHVYLGSIENVEVAIASLRDLPKLESFSSVAWPSGKDELIGGGNLSPGDFPNLSYVQLSGQLTRAGYEQLLQMPNLEYLRLTWDQSPDEALSIVARIPKLRILQFRSKVATDLGLSALGEARGLEHLSLELEQVDGSGMQSWSNLTRLERLFFQSTPIVDENLPYIGLLPALQDVDLEGSKVTAAGVEALRAKRPLVSIDH